MKPRRSLPRFELRSRPSGRDRSRNPDFAPPNTRGSLPGRHSQVEPKVSSLNPAFLGFRISDFRRLFQPLFREGGKRGWI